MKKKIKCKYCSKLFNETTDISRHYRYESEKCYNKWKSELDERPKIKCEICGKELRNISNTHCQRKHNISQEDYKNMYPNAKIFADGLLDVQKEKRENSINEKYTPEEIKNWRLEGVKRYHKMSKEEKKKWNKKNTEKLNETLLENYKKFLKKNPSSKLTFTKFRGLPVRNGYKKLKKDIEKYENSKKIILEKRKKTSLEKYGVEFAQQLEKTKEKQKKTLIKNFGSLKNAYDVISLKSVRSRMKKYGKIHFCPMFSISSQELFVELDKKLGDGYTIYYATKGKTEKSNEYQVPIQNGTCGLRYLDFYVKELNKSIEFNEKYHYYDKQMEADNIRLDEIKSSISNIQFYIVNKKHWEETPQKVISQCLEFLLKDV